jgi:hypothetical protein
VLFGYGYAVGNDDDGGGVGVDDDEDWSGAGLPDPVDLTRSTQHRDRRQLEFPA